MVVAGGRERSAATTPADAGERKQDRFSRRRAKMVNGLKQIRRSAGQASHLALTALYFTLHSVLFRMCAPVRRRAKRQ